jgi:hypothetical protein
MFGFWKKNQSKPTLNVKLGLESLGDRIVPAHLGVKVIEVPAASQAIQGLERANDTPTHETPNGAEAPHRRMIIIWTD